MQGKGLIGDWQRARLGVGLVLVTMENLNVEVEVSRSSLYVRERALTCKGNVIHICQWVWL